MKFRVKITLCMIGLVSTLDVPEGVEREGCTLVACAEGTRFAGYLLLADAVKEIPYDFVVFNGDCLPEYKDCRGTAARSRSQKQEGCQFLTAVRFFPGFDLFLGGRLRWGNGHFFIRYRCIPSIHGCARFGRPGS